MIFRTATPMMEPHHHDESWCGPLGSPALTEARDLLGPAGAGAERLGQLRAEMATLDADVVRLASSLAAAAMTAGADLPELLAGLGKRERQRGPRPSRAGQRCPSSGPGRRCCGRRWARPVKFSGRYCPSWPVVPPTPRGFRFEGPGTLEPLTRGAFQKHGKVPSPTAGNQPGRPRPLRWSSS